MQTFEKHPKYPKDPIVIWLDKYYWLPKEVLVGLLLLLGNNPVIHRKTKDFPGDLPSCRFLSPSKI